MGTSVIERKYIVHVGDIDADWNQQCFAKNFACHDVFVAHEAIGRRLNDRANLLAEGFYGATFGAGELVLGETILKAQKHLLKNSKDPYLLDIYNLIGDPATVMK